MDENQSNTQSNNADKFVAGIPMDEEDDKAGQEKKEEKPEVKPNQPEEKKEEKKEETKNDEKEKEENGGDSEKGEEKKPETPSRPVKYIPISQYSHEKKEWKDQIAVLESKIESLSNANIDPEKIKEFAKEKGLDDEVVEELISRFSKKEEKKEESPSLSPEQIALLEEASEIKAQQAFENEFEQLALPQIKKVFPNVTQEQINSLKEEIEKIATTEKFIDKDLDYVIFKNQEHLEKLLKSPVKGPENKTAGSENDVFKSEYTSQDFISGAVKFSELEKLSAESRNEIVKGFDSKTWNSYKDWVAQNDERL